MRWFHRILLAVLYASLMLVTIWLILQGSDYYREGALTRPHHPQHAEWRPSGLLGHGLGIVGTVMLLVLFLYSFRKRVTLARRWGRLSSWLNYHIFLGIAGPVLVTFHTAFKFNGIVVIAYLSMLAVALSGFIGRYLYVKIPHRVDGLEQSREEAQQELTKLREDLGSRFQLSSAQRQRIDGLASLSHLDSGGFRAVITLIWTDITAWLRRRILLSRFRRELDLSRQDVRTLRQLIHQQTRLSRQVAFWKTAQRLFHYWHVFHKPFAFTMVVIMILHVGVAISLGYTWIW